MRTRLFDWDEAKRLLNLRKHGLDFRDAPEVFAGPPLSRAETRCTDEEERCLRFRFLRESVVAVAYACRGEVTRIISMRKATLMSGRSSPKDSATDWQRLKQMADEDIDTSDLPEADEGFFERAELRYGGKPVTPAELVVLRASSDVAAWVRSASDAEREEAVAALREVMERHRSA